MINFYHAHFCGLSYKLIFQGYFCTQFTSQVAQSLQNPRVGGQIIGLKNVSNLDKIQDLDSTVVWLVRVWLVVEIMASMQRRMDQWQRIEEEARRAARGERSDAAC